MSPSFYSFCSLCGFSNALSFKAIDADELGHIQRYVQNDLNQRIKNLEQELDESIRSVFFGAYTSDPQRFMFNRGETKLIDQLVLHVRQTADHGGANQGAEHFIAYAKKSKKFFVGLSDLVQTPLGLFFGDGGSLSKSTLYSRTHIDSLKNDLFLKAEQVLHSFDGALNQMKGKLSENEIEVIKKDDDTIQGVVLCVLCDENRKTRKVKVFSRKVGTSHYWVLSNFQSHLKRCHGKKNTSLKKLDKNEEKKRNLTVLFNELPSTSANVLIRDKAAFEATRSNNISPATKLASDNSANTSTTVALNVQPVFELKTEIDQLCNTRREASIIILNDSSISEIGASCTSSVAVKDDDTLFDFHPNNNMCSGSASFEISNEQSLDDEWNSCENTVYIQMWTQNIKMINITLLNKENCHELCLGKAKTIKICEIEKDGNCLFAALTHQIFHKKLNSVEHVAKTQGLRQNVVKHILENFAHYEKELKGRIYEMRNRSKTENAQTDCLNYVKHCLSQPSCWGGAEALKAVSEIHQLNIFIIHPDGSCNSAIPYNSKFNRSVTLFFRDKNHYESVIEISRIDLTFFAKAIAAQEQKHQLFLYDFKNVKNNEILYVE